MPTQPTAPPALPLAPDPNDRSTFNARAYPWSAALPGFSAGLMTVAENAFSNAAEAAAAALTATAQAAAAQAAGNAAMWVSGTTYSAGVAVWSPANGRIYRRKTIGAGTTDPSADPTNWWEISLPPTLPIVDVSTDTTASVGVVYNLTASLVLTAPATLTPGDWFGFTNTSGTVTGRIARNGHRLIGLLEDMDIDHPAASAIFVYRGVSAGLVFYP